MPSPDTDQKIAATLLAVLLAATLQGCAGSDSSSRTWPDPHVGAMQGDHLNAGIVHVRESRGRACCTMALGTHRQEALAHAAMRFLGRSRVEVEGRRFTYDCAGLARGVYYSQGVDLYDGQGELKGGNGVGLIYGHVLQHGRIHYGPTVHPGDLVFFHNTWDFNRDGLVNDPLTHVGVVERVEGDGTVLFVSRVSRGIQRFRMNVREPDTHRTSDGRVLNDYMRRKGSRDPQATQYLTGQLFAAFGTVLR